MPKMVKMVSESRHEYGGRMLEVGDDFDAEEQHVELMTLLGRGRLKVATYDTRHMVAGGTERKAKRVKEA